jgi:hypothetical protein
MLNWFQLQLHARVYFTSNREQAKLLITRREPVNIGMETDKYYNHNSYSQFLSTFSFNQKFKFAFVFDYNWQSKYGNTKSAYTYLYDEQSGDKQLPENIALYIKTPIKMGDKIREISVINCIGIGFDSNLQPDYNYFLDETNNFQNINGRRITTNKFKPGKEEEYKQKLITIFKYIFYCAIDKRKNTIMLSYIGGGAFNEYYPPGNGDIKNRTKAYDEMFINAFGFAFENYYIKRIPRAQMFDKKIVLIGGGERVLPSINTKLAQLFTERKQEWKLPENFYSCPANGRIPNICFETQYNSDECLYVNAWDPHSIVGNGNYYDDSLDGYFGRSTAMGFLSCPFINEHLLEDGRYIQVP